MINMRSKFFLFVVGASVTLLMSSCASLFTKSTKEVTFRGIPGTTVIDADKNRPLAELGQNGFATAKVKKQLKSKNLKARNDGYEPLDFQLHTKIQPAFWGNIILGGIPGMGIDVATGKMMTYKEDFLDVTLKPLPRIETEVAEVIDTVPLERVDRNTPGATDMEKAIIRFFFDSDPRGARIYYRVISSVPEEVKNTNETYMTTTPLEETRSFNILGLTYENAPDVILEIKVSKRGFEDQVKRFNVRQALDQQEISSFFELVPKEK